MEPTEKDLRAMLASDPGNKAFVELVDILRSEGRYLEAIEVCLAGLSSSPDTHKGRLLLARLFYDRGFTPFALREISYVASAIPENDALKKLVQKLSPGYMEAATVATAPESTVAEAEFDFTDLDLIEEDDDKKS